MTDYADFTAELKDWANRGDWSDVLVASFVRDAESKFNAELRVDRMLQSDDSVVTDRCVCLPDDWLEFDLVLMATDQVQSGWFPLRYKPRDEFFRLPDSPYSGFSATSSNNSIGMYTIEGRQIYFGGAPDEVNGNTVRIHYYGEVPNFATLGTSWVYTKHGSMYRYAALMHADLHAVGEEDKAGNLKQLTEDMINKLNAQHRYSRASGSRLSRSRVRSFG